MTPQPRAVPRLPLSERLALTVPEFAALVGISRSKAYELVRSGEVPSVLFGSARRIPRRAVEERLEAAMGTVR